MFCPTPTGESCRYWDIGDKQIANNSRAGSVSVFMAIQSLGRKVEGVMEATKTVYMLVREPVQRFVSAKRKGHIYAETGNHFEPQVKLAVGPKVLLYKFPDHISQFGNDTGLGSIPWTNKSSDDTMVVSGDFQCEEDTSMFESITHPGFEW